MLIARLAIWFLNRYHESMTKIEEILKHLPYKVAFYDQTGRPLYNNGQNDSSLLADQELKDLEPWLLDELIKSPTGSLNFQVPSQAFDQILMQTYQTALDEQGRIIGIMETIADFKRPLTTYLDETAQALVGWSDATSGPSIKGSD